MKHQIEPGTKVRLKDYSADDIGGFGERAEAEQKLAPKPQPPQPKVSFSVPADKMPTKEQAEIMKRARARASMKYSGQCGVDVVCITQCNDRAGRVYSGINPALHGMSRL